MKTMNSRVLSIAALVLVGCGTEVGTEQQQNSVGPSWCDPGQILWRFGQTGTSYHSSEYDSQAPDASITPRQMNTIDRVLTFQCVYKDGTVKEERRATIEADCAGSGDCRVATGCSDLTSKLKPEKYGIDHTNVQWHCTNLDDTHYYYDVKAGADIARLWCPQPPAPVPTREPRNVCIPDHCYGASRRDADLMCQPDFSRLVINEKDIKVGSFSLTPMYKPFYGEPAIWPNEHRLDYGQRYHIDTMLLYSANIPEEARAVLWVTERFEQEGLTPVEVFRCQAHLFDVGKAVTKGSSTASISADIELSPECFNDALATRNRDIAAKKAGTTALALMARSGRSTQFHLSWDMEAKNVFVPLGLTPSTACAPNPLSFFYITPGTYSPEGGYDFISYYQQQELHVPFRAPRIPTPKPQLDPSWGGFFFGKDTFESNRLELGLADFRVVEPAITIRVNSTRTFFVPTEMEYYVANDGRHYYDRFFNVGDNYFKAGVTAYLVPHSPDGGYLPPSDDTGFQPVGTVLMPLPGVLDGGAPSTGPLGLTVAGNYVVTSPLKQAFITPNSKVSIDEGTRTFEVLGCLNGGYGPLGLRTEYWLPNINYELGGPFKVASVGNDEDTAKAYTPPGFPNPGRGCRWSKTPVVITIDKSVGAVEPISTRPWDGEVKSDDSGNGSDVQHSDNDNDRTCIINAAGRPACDSQSKNTQKGDGQFGRTYYSTSSAGVTDPGSGDPGTDKSDSSSASANGEMLGFQVLDPASEEETKQWETDNVSKQQKLTITLTPPFDKIWEALRRAQNGNPNPEWTKGRYAGFLGLGVGWGFKIPLNQFGMVTITFSVGFSISLSLEVVYSFKTDDKYVCLNQTTPCLQVNSDNLSFSDAVKECGKRGARLAELSSLAESSALTTFLNQQNLDDFWVGAQLNNEYSPASCLYTWNAGLCTDKHKTYFRWLSNDQTFATSNGRGLGTIDTSKIFYSGGIANTGLVPRVPDKAGLTLKKDGSIASAVLSSGHPSVCVYDPATKDYPIKTTAAVKAAVGIGVGIEWCWPNDEAGLCLSGTLNFATASITPQVVYSMHLLTDAMGRHAKRDNVQLTAEFALTLLEGSIEAKVKAWLFELSYTVLEFAGYKVEKMTLYDFNYPSIEAFH